MIRHVIELRLVYEQYPDTTIGPIVEAVMEAIPSIIPDAGGDEGACLVEAVVMAPAEPEVSFGS